MEREEKQKTLKNIILPHEVEVTEFTEKDLMLDEGYSFDLLEEKDKQFTRGVIFARNILQYALLDYKHSKCTLDGEGLFKAEIIENYTRFLERALETEAGETVYDVLDKEEESFENGEYILTRKFRGKGGYFAP